MSPLIKIEGNLSEWQQYKTSSLLDQQNPQNKWKYPKSGMKLDTAYTASWLLPSPFFYCFEKIKKKTVEKKQNSKKSGKRRKTEKTGKTRITGKNGKTWKTGKIGKTGKTRENRE